MTLVQEYTQTLVVESCSRAGCGLTFGLTDAYAAARRRDHKTFYCPNGHGQYYPGESDVEKANRETERAKQAAEYQRCRAVAAEDQARTAERSRRAVAGHLTRQRRRAANGVCPCCSRRFSNMADHIADKHPKYVAATKPAEADQR